MIDLYYDQTFKDKIKATEKDILKWIPKFVNGVQVFLKNEQAHFKEELI